MKAIRLNNISYTMENTLKHSIFVLDDAFLYLGSENKVSIYNYQTDKYENSSNKYPLKRNVLSK